MERQLDGAKTELFAEQRRAREKLDSMQERLEETREELQRVTEGESLLRSTCACLEEQQKQKQDQIEALELRVRQRRGEVGECEIRLASLEKVLAQKELQLLDLQEQHGALQAEREGLQGEVRNMTAQHFTALREAQEQAHEMVEAALKEQKKELTLAHEQQIQKAEEEKATSLRQQVLSITRHIESLQLHEEEEKQSISQEQQKEAAKIGKEKLHLEALEKVHSAIDQMRSKWEAERVESLQVHCVRLEEQNRKSLESARNETEREKSNALTLQHKVVELQTIVQELERDSFAQQKEQESVLAVICKSLKGEHDAELQRSHRHTAQSQRAVLRLEQAVQLAEEEADTLRAMLEERESRQRQAGAELVRQRGHWTQELEAECRHLHLLLEQSGEEEGAARLPHSPTVEESLTNLRALRERLKHLIIHLHQELHAQRENTEQLCKDKEQELHIQRQKLRTERDQALDSLKERLIQDHVEELSSLNRARVCDGGDEGGGVASSLRRQLKDKDLELRQVQRSMSQWKEHTAARLACKFEEELTAELERKTPKAHEERHRRPEGEKRINEKDPQPFVCLSSSPAVDSAAASSRPSDTASLKLLHYLQSRIKQLRVENQSYTSSSSSLKKNLLDVPGSFKTITQAQDTMRTHSLSSILQP
ncbi:uncharacterized protein LOC143001391 [Genypterus blacodes]|uniref:uncharacterized protein LOC143001391 n=1 Tax=Genypterus blacodes TaxID=154954 RepID=UPI003F75B789